MPGAEESGPGGGSRRPLLEVEVEAPSLEQQRGRRIEVREGAVH